MKQQKLAGISKVVGVSKLRTKYEAPEAKRQLCSLYDIFLADERIIPSLPKLLGNFASHATYQFAACAEPISTLFIGNLAILARASFHFKSWLPCYQCFCAVLPPLEVCRRYSVFTCACLGVFWRSDILLLVFYLAGKTFFRKKKQPIPVDLTTRDWGKRVKDAVQATYLFKPTGNSVSIKYAAQAQSLLPLCNLQLWNFKAKPVEACKQSAAKFGLFATSSGFSNKQPSLHHGHIPKPW